MARRSPEQFITNHGPTCIHTHPQASTGTIMHPPLATAPFAGRPPPSSSRSAYRIAAHACACQCMQRMHAHASTKCPTQAGINRHGRPQRQAEERSCKTFRQSSGVHRRRAPAPGTSSAPRSSPPIHAYPCLSLKLAARLHGHAWPCTDMHGHARICTDMHGRKEDAADRDAEDGTGCQCMSKHVTACIHMYMHVYALCITVSLEPLFVDLFGSGIYRHLRPGKAPRRCKVIDGNRTSQRTAQQVMVGHGWSWWVHVGPGA